jgi:hypothetical protein
LISIKRSILFCGAALCCLQGLALKNEPRSQIINQFTKNRYYDACHINSDTKGLNGVTFLTTEQQQQTANLIKKCATLENTIIKKGLELLVQQPHIITFTSIEELRNAFEELLKNDESFRKLTNNTREQQQLLRNEINTLISHSKKDYLHKLTISQRLYFLYTEQHPLLQIIEIPAVLLIAYNYLRPYLPNRYKIL